MKKMTLLSFLFRSCAAVVLLAGTARCLAGDVSDKLAELEKQRNKFNTLHTVAKTTNRMGSGNRETTTETWEKLADGKHKLRCVFRTKAVAAEGAEPVETETVMANDGTTAWREMAVTDSKRIVFKGKSAVRSELEDIRKMMGRGEARLREEETVLDQPCTQLEIKGKDGGNQLLASYWISNRYGVILKSVVESANQGVTEMRVTELKVDETVADSLFEYRPPADAQIIDSDSIGKKKGD
jgi:outer membrane lipoprotein-sorting protein